MSTTSVSFITRSSDRVRSPSPAPRNHARPSQMLGFCSTILSCGDPFFCSPARRRRSRHPARRRTLTGDRGHRRGPRLMARHRPGSSGQSARTRGPRRSARRDRDPRNGTATQVPKAARTMTTNRTLTDSEIEALADEAEAGYDIDHLVARRNKRGRPTLGSAPASVESVRLDPELKDQLILRAEQDHTSPSDVIREALRRYLQPS